MSNFRITPHLREKAEREGVALASLLEILLNPEVTYYSFTKKAGNRVPRTCKKCGTQQQKWTGTTKNGQKFCVVVNPCCGDAITYWVDQAETDLRVDQKAAGVTGYRGRDGKWRS